MVVKSKRKQLSSAAGGSSSGSSSGSSNSNSNSSSSSNSIIGGKNTTSSTGGTRRTNILLVICCLLAVVPIFDRFMDLSKTMKVLLEQEEQQIVLHQVAAAATAAASTSTSTNTSTSTSSTYGTSSTSSTSTATRIPSSTGTTTTSTTTSITTSTSHNTSSTPSPASRSTTSITATGLNYTFLNYDDYQTRFPLPGWLDDYLKTQPPPPSPLHHDNDNDNPNAKFFDDPNEKFIVLICYKHSRGTKWEDCGGLADRLSLLPYQLWWAAKTKRRLFIHYQKPYPLEAFLVPPPSASASTPPSTSMHHGFDWRLPPGKLQRELEQYANRSKEQYTAERYWAWHQRLEQEPYASQRVWFMNHNLIIDKLVKTGLMEQIIGISTNDIWPGLFRRLFVPSYQVAKEIMDHPILSQLLPGQYASAHIRAKWPGKALGKFKYTNIKWWLADKAGGQIDMNDQQTFQTVANIADHAVECAVRIMPKTRYVYMSSDAEKVVQYLLEQSPYWANNHANDSSPRAWNPPARAPAQPLTTLEQQQSPSNSTPLQHGWGVPPWEIDTRRATIIARPNYHIEPKHYDSTVWDTPNDGIAIFIDLWIMAHAGCHSLGVGGVGRFGSVLSGYHRNCTARHRDYQYSSPSCATPAERKIWKQQHYSEEDYLNDMKHIG